MMLQTKYQGSRPCGFRQEDIFMFLPIKAYVKPVTPKARLFLASGLYLKKNVVEVYLMILHTKIEGSRPCGFRQ